MRSDYIRLRDRYLPTRRRIVFILESPPISGRYFYNPEGSASEPLFRAMMKDVLEIFPSTKDEGLQEFASRGYLLVDATYTPVNDEQLSQHARNEAILSAFPLLLDDLRGHTDEDTQLVLIKANICKLLEPLLIRHGSLLLNRGATLPFPSTGHQTTFRNAIRPLLGL